MPRTFVFLLVLVFAFGAVVGQGKAQDRVELELWIPEPRPAYKEALEGIAKRFNERYPHIHVNITQFAWTDAYIRWPASASAGTLPDITYIADGWLGYMETISGGGFVDVSDVLQRLGRERFTSSINLWDQNGKILGFPYIRNPWFLFYRKDLFEEAGLNPPDTWNDVLKAAEVLTNPRQRRYGIAMGAQLDWLPRRIFGLMLYTHGGHLIDRDGNIVLNSPQAAAALRTMVKLFDYSPPGSVDWGYTEINRAFASGQAAMVITLPIIVDDVLRANPQLVGSIGVAIPQESVANVTEQPTKGWAIFQQTKHPEEAKLFVEFLFEEESYLAFLNAVPPANIPVYDQPGAVRRFFEENPTVQAFPDVIQFVIDRSEGYLLGAEEYGANPYTGAMEGEGVVERMINRVLVDGWSVEQALAWAEEQIKRIYGR